MQSHRTLDRIKKRITVRFGQEKPEQIAFTEDLSPTGIFIKTAQVINPGRPVRVAFELDQGMVNMEGRVVWAKKVPVNMLRVVKKCGMGIRITRFLEGKNAYLGLFPKASGEGSGNGV